MIPPGQAEAAAFLARTRNPSEADIKQALANNLAAVVKKDPDAPGYAAVDTLYPFGHGLGYRTP